MQFAQTSPVVFTQTGGCSSVMCKTQRSKEAPQCHSSSAEQWAAVADAAVQQTTGSYKFSKKGGRRFAMGCSPIKALTSLSKSSFSRQARHPLLCLGMKMILKIVVIGCRVLLQGFTCSPLVFHRRHKDAQAGAGLQASHHGGQCHLAPGDPEPAPASPCQCTTSAPLCLSPPVPHLGSHSRRGWRSWPRPNPQQTLASPRRDQPG